MGFLVTGCQDLLDTLSALEGVTVFGFIPERLVPPTAVITMGSPFAIEGLTYGDLLVNWEVELTTETAANETTTLAVLDLIERALPLLIASGYEIKQVGQPIMRQANNAQYLSVTISVADSVRPE